ncbi:MAG: hypothetical protein AABY83_06450 [Pseudomonadota bacterium]
MLLLSKAGMRALIIFLGAARSVIAAPAPCSNCVPIYTLQGASEHSAYAGKEVTTRGIVTLWSADHKNYWLQDKQGDNDPTTSDAVMVVYRAAQGVPPQIGDWIELTAVVEDYAASNGLPVTRLHPTRDVSVFANAQALPEAVEIDQVPTQSIAAASKYWQAMEGMRVSVRNALVVGPSNLLGEFVVLRPTGKLAPGELLHAQVTPLDAENVDYRPERIFIAAKPLQITPLKTGDGVDNVTGIVDYRRNQYKILAQSVSLATISPVRTAVSRNTAGNLAVVTVNVENLFDLEDDPNKADENNTPTPGQLEIKLKKLTMLIAETLKTPAILVVQEVENQTILQTLGDRINAVSGARYVATSLDSSDRRGIEVGFLWDANQTQSVRVQSVTSAVYTELTGDAGGVPGREPLIGWFRTGAIDIAVIGVHFKSKLGDDPLFGARQPPLRDTEEIRKQQARVLRVLYERLIQTYPSAAWIVAGDFNDHSFGEPGEGADHPLAIVRGENTHASLFEVTDWVPWRERYTYIHEGNAQQLDHMLINDTAKELSAAANILHANADFPAVWANDYHHPWRVADHDIIELRLQIAGAATPGLPTKHGGVHPALLVLLLLWTPVRSRCNLGLKFRGICYTKSRRAKMRA